MSCLVLINSIITIHILFYIAKSMLGLFSIFSTIISMILRIKDISLVLRETNFNAE